MKTETLQTRLKIVSCLNGWAVYDFNAKTSQSVCNDSLSIEYGPSYVFNSPAELANAVANLVQFGSVEKPPTLAPEGMRPYQAGMRPIAEFYPPTDALFDDSNFSGWYLFTTSTGLKIRYITPDGQSSPKNLNHKEGCHYSRWFSKAGVGHFRLLSKDEAEEQGAYD